MGSTCPPPWLAQGASICNSHLDQSAQGNFNPECRSPFPARKSCPGLSQFLVLKRHSLNFGHKALFKFYHLANSMSYCAVPVIFPYSDRAFCSPTCLALQNGLLVGEIFIHLAAAEILSSLVVLIASSVYTLRSAFQSIAQMSLRLMIKIFLVGSSLNIMALRETKVQHCLDMRNSG